MSGFALALVGLSLWSGPDEPGALINQLGSPRYAEREAAATALRGIGRAALPSLRSSRHARDPEIRTRVEALIVKIEGSLLLEATPVQLDFRGRPLEEVVRTINERSGHQLTLAPSARGAWASRPVTIVSDRPVPFWAAVERICDAAGVQYSFAGATAINARANAIALAPGENRPGGPMSDFGPIRVNLMSLHYQRDLVFGNLGPSPGSANFGQGPATEQFNVRMQVAAEPHLSLRQSGPLRLTTATDELGQSLLPAGPPAGQAGAGPASFFGAGTGAIQLSVPLKRPDKPGRAIRVLGGTIPFTVATRRPEPLSIPLDGAGRKPFRNDDATVVVHELKSTPNPGQHSLEVSITPEGPHAGLAEPVTDFGPSRQATADFGPLQIEILDASGSPLNWYSSSQAINGDERRLTLVTIGGPAGGAPATLRFHSMIRTGVEVPFEFRDVPMP